MANILLNSNDITVNAPNGNLSLNGKNGANILLGNSTLLLHHGTNSNSVVIKDSNDNYGNLRLGQIYLENNNTILGNNAISTVTNSIALGTGANANVDYGFFVSKNLTTNNNGNILMYDPETGQIGPTNIVTLAGEMGPPGDEGPPGPAATFEAGSNAFVAGLSNININVSGLTTSGIVIATLILPGSSRQGQYISNIECFTGNFTVTCSEEAVLGDKINWFVPKL